MSTPSFVASNKLEIGSNGGNTCRHIQTPPPLLLWTIFPAAATLRVSLHLQHRGSSVCITAAQSCKEEGGMGPWIRFLPPWTGDTRPGHCSPSHTPSWQWAKPGRTPSLIGGQWLHSPPPGLGQGDRGVTHSLIATLQGTGLDKHGLGPQWLY